MPQAVPRAGDPASAAAAPGRLEMVRGFVNTLDIEQGIDELTTPAGRRRWLGGNEASAAQVRQAVVLREALRGVLRSHVAGAAEQVAGRDPQVAGPAAELRKIAASLRTRLEVGDDGAVTAAAGGSGPAAALAGILLIAAEAGTAGTWSRLKACSADDCQWAFYDRSPTRSGCWCSMRICGSRAKSRAYRQRAAVRA